jgi:mRNA interferase MazF
MRGGTVFEQRDIVLIPFPYSDLTGFKQRPALIISNKSLNRGPDRICCLITSKKPDDGLLMAPSAFESGKLPFRSWVKPHRIFTIHEKIIRKKLCTVAGDFHDSVLDSMNMKLRQVE